MKFQGLFFRKKINITLLSADSVFCQRVKDNMIMLFFYFLQATPESTGIKFPDFKQAGVFVRSQKVGD